MFIDMLKFPQHFPGFLDASEFQDSPIRPLLYLKITREYYSTGDKSAMEV